MLNELPKLQEMICHSEHTFVYSQVLLNVLLNEGGGDAASAAAAAAAGAATGDLTIRNGHLIKRLCQEIVKQAHHK